MATLSDLRTVARDSSMYDKNDEKSTRVIDRAVNTALRLLAQAHEWEYYNTIGRINTVAQQTSGTVAVTNGASTVTLTGGTWPTTLTDYNIRIASETVDHGFSARVGANTGTMATGQVWNGTAQTSGTYVLYRSRYSLPSDCRQFGGVVTQNLDWCPQYVDKEAFEQMKAAGITSSGDPYIFSHDNSYIYLWPWTGESKALMFNYQRWPAEASTAGDTIDWDGNRIDLLYAAMDVALDVHQKKLSWLDGIASVERMAVIMSSNEPKRHVHDCVRPMFCEGRPIGYHRMTWGGTATDG